jgi:hypothetical protein
MTSTSSLAAANSDMLTGAELLRFVFGDLSDPKAFRRARRRLYHLAAEVAPQDRLPLFRLGPRVLAGRKSTLVRWMAEREAAAALVPPKDYRTRCSAGRVPERATTDSPEPAIDPASDAAPSPNAGATETIRSAA